MTRKKDITDILKTARIDTQAVRAGQVRSAEGEHAEALFLTSSYVFDSAAAAAARFAGDQPGNVYSRYTNPTVRNFQDRLAVLEGGDACVATASGMAAILCTCLALLKAGDHVVCSRSVFGTTSVLFTKYMQKFGVTTSFVALTDFAQWEAAITSNTKFLFLETPSNPLCEVADVQKLAALAHSRGCLLIVDNCFCTPALQKPLALGADIVIHSATKFIDGQGRCMGGAVVSNTAIANEVLGVIRTTGPTMSAFNAWVFLKGLETLRLRMQAHSANAQVIAEYLNAHPKVEKVYFAGLPTHPGHDLAKKQQTGFGGVLSFQVKGSRDAAWRFIDSTSIMSLTANLGDTKTTIVHPATTTHGRLSADEKLAAGITENLIRIAVGLEDPEDIIADMERGFAAV